MAASTEPKTMLKLLIDTNGKRVLFAEANKNFVDFLFQILSLPVATLVSILRNHVDMGSLPNLYDGIKNLNNSYMQSHEKKLSLLKQVPLFIVPGSVVLPRRDDDAARKSYLCDSCYLYASVEPGTFCPDCKEEMEQMISYVGPPPPPDEIGFVKDMVTYMVMDDLVVAPLSTTSSFALLHRFNLTDISAVEEKVVEFGLDEAVKLLSASLRTNNVLTSVFLNCTSTTSRTCM
ncbi:hypothetical protein ACP275_14G251700 [Erythranthe tilingii]